MPNPLERQLNNTYAKILKNSSIILPMGFLKDILINSMKLPKLTKKQCFINQSSGNNKNMTN